MKSSTSAQKLIITLKQQLKVKGLHYRDIAARLQVSEGTVKRYFSGKGVSVDVLEQLAEIVELDLFTLAALAQQQDLMADRPTKRQHAALRKNKLALAVFNYLYMGFTPAQLIEEFDLADHLDGILAKLEAIGLIRRLANNGIKLLAKPTNSGDTDEDVLSRRANLARVRLTDMARNIEKCEWSYFGARLSSISTARLRELVKRFESDIEALSKRDIDLPPSETQWYRILISAEPTSRSELFRGK